MKSSSSEILAAWYALLNGNVNYDATTIPVYRVTADPNANSHFILLAPLNEINTSANNYFGREFTLKVTIVTKHNDQIDDKIVDSIDNSINELLFPTGWGSTAIKTTTNYQVAEIIADSASFLAQIDGNNRIYSKETVYSHKLIQQ